VESQRQARLAALEALGFSHIENRRWQDASAVFSEIDTVLPGSELAKAARARIAAGIGEEETQFIAYWSGQALAELEARRLNEAEAAVRKVIERFPADAEAARLLEKINGARASLERGEALAAARRLLEERRWDDAIRAAEALIAKTPDDAEARDLINEATAARDRFLADEARAIELLNQAKARDHGEFDQQALDWLREAAALAPGHPEIAAQLEKVAAYTRTLRVPGDFATPAEALATARDRDRILLADGMWQGPLVVNAAIELQGAGLDKTAIVCAPDAGSALTIGPDARGARISGITFRHEEFRPEGSDRFSAALVRGGAATFSDCAFVNASGHGLAVIEGGEAFALRCRFADNSWNGASAIGRGSMLEIRDSQARDNFGHGIESWDHAAVTLANNSCEANARNGIHSDNGSAQAVLENNQLSGNREFGLVITSAASGRVTGNACRGNLLGGMVIRKAAAALTVSGNQATRNQGPGLVLEKGLASEGYLANSLEKNTGSNLLPGADLAAE
jgi:parallel beta-helix repeat protein